MTDGCAVWRSPPGLAATARKAVRGLPRSDDAGSGWGLLTVALSIIGRAC